jgi:nickel-dependent lactate racemase
MRESKMSVVATPVSLGGKGHPDSDLSPSELRQILAAALSAIGAGSSVLAIVADKTRDDNTDVLFPFAAKILQDRKIKKFDALIAQGTHAPMSERDKLSKVGASEISAIPKLGHIFDHDWADPEKLVTIGILNSSQVRRLLAV